jgi:hypothetical protein
MRDEIYQPDKKCTNEGEVVERLIYRERAHRINARNTMLPHQGEEEAVVVREFGVRGEPELVWAKQRENDVAFRDRRGKIPAGPVPPRTRILSPAMPVCYGLAQ